MFSPGWPFSYAQASVPCIHNITTGANRETKLLFIDLDLNHKDAVPSCNSDDDYIEIRGNYFIAMFKHWGLRILVWGTGSVDGPGVLMEEVTGQHEHHNKQNNDKEEKKSWFAVFTFKVTTTIRCYLWLKIETFFVPLSPKVFSSVYKFSAIHL